MKGYGFLPASMLVAALSAELQIASASVFCGSTAPGVSIAIDRSNGIAVLTLRRKPANVDLRLPGTMDAVERLCMLPNEKLLIFGETGSGLFNIAIVDISAGAISDSFYGYSPTLSPDGRWLVRRKFYPAQAPRPSEEYLLYDTARNASQNRLGGSGPDDMDAAGVVVYPVVAGGKPFENGFLPPDQTHTWRSRSFFWAEDSNSFVFGDSVENELSVVLVVIRDGEAKTLVYAPKSFNECEDTVKVDDRNPSITLEDAQFGNAGSGLAEITLVFGINGVSCGRRTVSFREFKPAAVIVPVRPPRRPAVLGK